MLNKCLACGKKIPFSKTSCSRPCQKAILMRQVYAGGNKEKKGKERDR